MKSSRKIGSDLAWADGVIGRAIENAGALPHGDVGFVMGMAENLHRYGAGTFLSEPQLKWLRDIERKLKEA